MPRVFHETAFLRRIPASTELELAIVIGNVQHGEWWIWADRDLIRSGTDTDVRVQLGPAERYYGKLVQVEVRCDDTNAHSDRLRATIALAPTDPPVEWSTDNIGQETPNGMMTSIADIFVMPVIA